MAAETVVRENFPDLFLYLLRGSCNRNSESESDEAIHVTAIICQIPQGRTCPDQETGRQEFIFLPSLPRRNWGNSCG